MFLCLARPNLFSQRPLRMYPNPKPSRGDAQEI